MPLKVSTFFESSGDGWSEVLYNSANDPTALIPAGGLDLQPGVIPQVGSLQNLLVARLGMLDKTAFIRHVRVADIANPFQYVSADFDALSAPGTYTPKAPGVAAPGAEIWSDVLVEIRGGTAPNIHHGRHFLRGIPEAIVKPPQTLLNEPGFLTAFVTWRDTLIFAGGNWILWSRPAKAMAADITGFAVDTNGTVGWLQATLQPLAGVHHIGIIRGMRAPRGWNGQHAGVSQQLPVGLVGQGGLVAGLAVKLGPTRQPKVSTPTWDTQKSGTYQPFVGVQTPITEAHLVRLTTHKVGRPFGEPVGRRSR